MSNAPWGPPQPAAYPGPPPPRPPRGYGPLIVGLTIGLAVVLVATIAAVHWLSAGPGRTVTGAPPATTASPTPSPSASPTPNPSASPTPNPSASASASASPSITQSPTAAPPSQPPPSPSPRPSPGRTTSAPPKAPERPTPKMGLASNSIYAINLSGSGTCHARVRRPKPPLKNAALAPYLRTVVRCLVDAFKAPLAKQGFTLTTPKVKTYSGSIKTPCGRLGSNSNPSFYCSGTIYWPVSSDDGREAYTFARLGYVGLTAHEFGHHLQQTTGMFYDYGTRYAAATRKGKLALSRRLELQAQCFEGVFLSHDSSALHFSSRDRREIRTWHSYTGDEDPPASRQPDHGTSREQVAWLNRGLAGADFGRCNTWSASSRSVK